MNKKNEDLEKLIAFSKLNEECKGCGRLKNNGGQCKGKRQGPPCCITRKGRKMLFLFFIAFLASSIFFTPITGEAISLNEKIFWDFYEPVEEETENIDEIEKTDKYSLLIRNKGDRTEIHVYDKNTQNYLYTIVKNENGIKKYIIESVAAEDFDYKRAGFQQLPDTHIVNSPEYEWFIDQHHTGEYSSVNCGASSIAMAMNWLKKNSTSPEDVRSTVRSEDQGGGLSVEEMGEYLCKKNIKHTTLFLDMKDKNQFPENTLCSIIRNKNIAIIFFDSSSLEENKNYEQKIRIGRPYEGGGPHASVLMGCVEVGGELFFELYDPAGKKGRDYFVKADNLIKAMEDYWNPSWVFEIYRNQD